MLISNIQRFCLNDGSGIRTTVFFMGCPLRCFWCSNPENLTCEQKEYVENNKTMVYGKYYSVQELFNEIIKDKDFFENGGGVTFSGGECLLQLVDNIDLLKKIKEENISICIESSLNVPKSNLQEVMQWIDEYIIDLKVFTSKAKEINANPKLIIENLKLLEKLNNNVTFRIPIVKNFNDDMENLNKIKEIIHNFHPKNVEIFPVHNLGKEKYIKLNLIPPIIEKQEKADILKVKEYLNYPNIKILET